jgi:hypothetical protein
VKEFVECQMPAQYVEIESTDKKSHLQVLNASKLVLSAHERDCERIFMFTDGSNDYGIISILRPFMEEHLRVRFHQQVIANGLEDYALGDLIDKLFEIRLFDDANKKRLHAFRESLNPDHHKSVDDENIEETRLEAKDLMNLLYGDLA